MDGKRVLMHANHGVIVCGDSVARRSTICIIWRELRSADFGDEQGKS